MRGYNTKLPKTHIDQQTAHHSPRSRRLKPFYTGQMQNDTDRPTSNDVKEPNKTEEQLHIDPRFRTNPNLQQDDVNCVEQGGEQCKTVSEKRILSTLDSCQ